MYIYIYSINSIAYILRTIWKWKYIFPTGVWCEWKKMGNTKSKPAALQTTYSSPPQTRSPHRRQARVQIQQWCWPLSHWTPGVLVCTHGCWTRWENHELRCLDAVSLIIIIIIIMIFFFSFFFSALLHRRGRIMWVFIQRKSYKNT